MIDALQIGEDVKMQRGEDGVKFIFSSRWEAHDVHELVCASW
jgi:hypothetical protein